MNLFIVEEQPGCAQSTLTSLQSAGLDIAWAAAIPGQETSILLNEDVDLGLIYSDRATLDGCQFWLECQKKSGLNIPFIVISSQNDLETALACMKLGASDYLLSTDTSRLPQVIEQILNGHKPSHSVVPGAANLEKAEIALQKSEERFSKIFKMSPLPISITTLAEGRYVDFNDEFVKLIGSTREELPTSTSLKMGVWPDLETRSRWLGDLRKNRKSENRVETYHTSSGKEVTVIASDEIIEIAGQECILTVYSDITERIKTEKMLRRNEEDLKVRANQLALINEIGRQISAVLEVDRLLETAADLIQNRFGYHHVAIFTLDEKAGELVLRAHQGKMADQMNLDFRQKVSEGMLGWAARHGEKILSNDVRTNKYFMHCFSFEDKTNSELCVPIRVGSNVMGVLDIQSPSLNAFDVSDVTVMETLANQLAVAFENARLVEELSLELAERRRAEDKMNKQVHRLAALRDIDMAITASLDLRITLQIILDKVSSQLNIEAVALFLLNERTQLLEYAAGRGFHKSLQKQMRLNLSESLAGRTIRERSVLIIPDLTQDHSLLSQNPVLSGEGFVTYYGVPLITKGMVKGVLEIYQRSPLPSDPEWLGFLESLATQAAIAIDDARLFEDLQRTNSELILAYDTSLEGWSRALDMRDQETEGHSRRVTDMTLSLAQSMGIHGDELVHVYRGALLHDIGKMGIPDSILLKPGPLTPEEWIIMRQHPENAYMLLSPISHLRRAMEIPYSHHEKWDGSGYPRGLKGEEIPLSARIFAVVDSWDALNSDRPYRKAWSKKEAYNYILSQSGKSFDPAVVEKFTQLFPLD